LKGFLGEPTDRRQFKYDYCEDDVAKAWIETVWPQIYSKPGMNANKLVSEQFAMGVYLEKRKNLSVNWASFAAEINASQIRKYKTTIGLLTAEREKLLRACGN
jgi:hypothetical protein